MHKQSVIAPNVRSARTKEERKMLKDERKQMRKLERDEMNAARGKELQAQRTGDVKNYPQEDKGPVKDFIRDYVDARLGIAEFFMPMAIIFIFLSLFLQSIMPALATIGILVIYAYIVLAIIDQVIMWQRMKRKMIQKFGFEKATVKGNCRYAVMRAIQMRRSRLPGAKYKKRGGWPEGSGHRFRLPEGTPTRFETMRLKAGK
jgi:hypothetical protein